MNELPFSARGLLTAFALIGTLVFAAAETRASPVSIQGGFSSFTSVVQPPNSVPTHTFVFGTEVSPSSGVPFTVTAPALLDFMDFNFDGNTDNRVRFVPGGSSDVAAGQDFLLGRFELTNGAWFGQADIAFTIFTESTNPALDGHVLSDVLRMKQTPFNSNPDWSADIYSIVGAPPLNCGGPLGAQCNSFRVYELFDSPILSGGLRVDGISNAGTLELWGHIGSLDLTEIRNPQGAMFLSGSLDLDPGSIIVRPGNSVPEPSGLALLACSLLGLVGATRRSARAN